MFRNSTGPETVTKRTPRADTFRRGGRGQILLVCSAMLGLMTGQQMINPLLAPLARELRFSELELGVVMAVGASGIVFASSFWGRRAAAWGHGPVLILSLVVAAAALGGFAAVVQAGLVGLVREPLTLIMVIATRGVLFGAAWAATPVTVQSFIAGVTEGEADRVRGMTAFGVAQGVGLAVGPALGGVLSVGGLLLPMYIAPGVLLLVAAIIAVGLPRRRVATAPQPTGSVRLGDWRVWPFLVCGFGLYLGLTMVLMTLGFLLQDRVGLAPKETGSATGLVMLIGAGMIAVIQGAVVPRLRWAPYRLIQLGAVVMTAGMALMVFADTLPTIATGVGLLGSGLGFGMPGIMSAPSLLVGRAEQVSVAGLVSATTGATFVAGPLLGNGLYELGSATPYAVGLIGLSALTAFTLAHPAVRQLPSSSGT